jgi:hypothetical protein
METLLGVGGQNLRRKGVYRIIKEEGSIQGGTEVKAID